MLSFTNQSAKQQQKISEIAVGSHLHSKTLLVFVLESGGRRGVETLQDEGSPRLFWFC